jgi:hypothetical protein
MKERVGIGAFRGLVSVLGFVALSCAKPSPPPPPAPVTIEGVLIERLSGRPIPDKALRLSGSCGACPSFPDVYATTGADGSFRFEQVTIGRKYGGEIGGSYGIYHMFESGYVDASGNKWFSLRGPKEKIAWGRAGNFDLYTTTVPTPMRGFERPAFQLTSARVDIGTVLHNDADFAARALGPHCDSGKVKGLVPEGGLAVLARADKKDAKWSYDEDLRYRLAGAWKPAWPAFICIKKSYETVGYYSGVGVKEQPASRVTWKVAVIDAVSGARFGTSVTADPPYMAKVTTYQGTTTVGSFGDPAPDFLAWIAERFPNDKPSANTGG